MAPVRLIIVDDHALFRAGLISLLGEMPEFQVVGEARTGLDALEVIQRTHPNVVLLDVDLPGMGGVETVRAIRKGKQKVKVLLLTVSENDEGLSEAINAGADGYLLKDASPNELRKALQSVTQVMSALSPHTARQVSRVLNNDNAPVPVRGLSSREIEVLICLMRGKTTVEIGNDLFISENTVKTHVRHILEKLDVSTRAEAVSKATQLGLIGKN